MKHPTITQARTICEALGATYTTDPVRGVIVLAFSRGNVAGASYGETKAECKQVGYTLDRIIEYIMGGLIPVWATEESEAAALKARDAEIIRLAVEDGSYCPACKVPWADHDCESRLTADQYNEGSDDF